MWGDGLVQTEKIKTGKNQAGSIVVGLVFITLFAVMIFAPAVGQLLKNEVKRTAGEKAYMEDLQAVLETHDINDAEIGINKDEYCNPNIRYYNVAVNSTSLEGLSSDEKQKLLIELKAVKWKPSEEEVFIVVTRPILVTREASYQIGEPADDGKLVVVKNPREDR